MVWPIINMQVLMPHVWFPFFEGWSRSIRRCCLVSAVRSRAASTRSLSRAWSCVDCLRRNCHFATAAAPPRPWIYRRWSANRERMLSSLSQEGFPLTDPCAVAGAASCLLLAGDFLLSHHLSCEPVGSWFYSWSGGFLDDMLMRSACCSCLVFLLGTNMKF